VIRRLLDRLADLGAIVLPLLVVGALVAAYLTFAGIRELLPPREIAMAAGRPDSGYARIARQYRAILARDGIALEILDTAGSVENARLLADGAADVALIQGGVRVPDEAGAEALAAVFLEPLFIFHRPDTPGAADLAQWRGLRVAAGEPGSGTRAAVTAIAAALDLSLDQGVLLDIGGGDAAAALRTGRADVAVFVAPVDAPYLAALFRDPGITVASLRDTEALARRLAFVRHADIPPAALDYAGRVPAERVALTTTVATLTARGDLHPALVNRLVRAAQEIHAGPVLVSDRLRFPAAEGAQGPMNPQAAALLEGGAGGLDRVLPYWIAAQVTRVTVLLLPLVVLLVPLIRALPGLYAWRVRMPIYRRYSELVAIDAEAEREGPMPPERRATLLDRLDSIEREARALRVPTRYRENVYTLRLHIDLVRRKLTAAAPPPSRPG